MNPKNISLIGNCQTAALCKFLRELPNHNECFWLCFDQEWTNGNWVNNKKIWGETQIKYHIFDYDICMNKLKNADIIIYQPNFLHNNIVNKIYTNNKTLCITLSPIFITNIDYMIQKETKYDTTIKITNIINNNKDKKLYIKQDNHPTIFLILEIVKQICLLANMDFFSESAYNKLLLNQYPDY